MCIIILVPAGEKLPSDDVLEKCAISNPDNMGFMFTHDRKIKIAKFKHTNFLKFTEYIAEKHFDHGKTSPFVIHFRQATDGVISLSNTHPFFVNKNLAFAHNGVISKMRVGKDSEYSDTVLFKKKVLSKLPSNFLEFPALVELIEDYTNSKFVFLSSEGQTHIIGEKTWGARWENGVWFSKTSYKTVQFSQLRCNDRPLATITAGNICEICKCYDSTVSYRSDFGYPLSICKKCAEEFADERILCV